MTTSLTQSALNDKRLTPDALGIFCYIRGINGNGLSKNTLLQHFEHYSNYDLQRSILELEKYHYANLINKDIGGSSQQWLTLDYTHDTSNSPFDNSPLKVTRTPKDDLSDIILKNKQWLNKQNQSSDFNQVYLNFAIGFKQLPPITTHSSQYCIKWINHWLKTYKLDYINKEINKILKQVKYEHRHLSHPFNYVGKSLTNDYQHHVSLSQYSSTPIQHSTFIGRMFSKIIHKHEV